MNTTIEPTRLPLLADPDGTIRIAGSRVTLDVIIDAFRAGESPEEIAEGLESLNLSDVYGAITYYLFHRETVEQYLRRREQLAETLTRHSGKSDLRERLIARQVQERP